MTDYKNIRQAKCTECEWVGEEDLALMADNPFDLRVQIIGCPECKEVNSLVIVCNFVGCEQIATCGMPLDDSYHQVCGEHYDRLQEQNC